MHQKDDWLNIAAPSEIKSILRFVLDSKTLLRMEVQDCSVSVITTILDIDAYTIVIDNTASDSISQQLIKADNVYLEAALKGMQISFTGVNITPWTHLGRSALRLAMPKSLKRMQRREFARTQVPAKNPALCILPISSRTGEVRLALQNISASGVSLIDSERLLDNTEGTPHKDCQLELPDVGRIKMGLRVVQSNNTFLENGETAHCVGCAFVDISDTALMLVRHYAWRVEQTRQHRSE